MQFQCLKSKLLFPPHVIQSFSFSVLNFVKTFQLNRRPTLPTRMKIKEAIRLYEKIQLIEIVRAVFNPVKISEDDIIQLDCPKCLLSLNEFFRNTTTK